MLQMYYQYVDDNEVYILRGMNWNICGMLVIGVNNPNPFAFCYSMWVDYYS